MSEPPMPQVLRLQDLITAGRANLQTGPFGTSLHASSYVSSGVPVVAVKNIGDNRLIHDDIPLIAEFDAMRLDRYRLCENDILFGRKGAVDRRALIQKQEEGWVQGSDCIRLRFDASVDSSYVSFFLGSFQARVWLRQHAHGATMPTLNQQILGLLPIPLPPLPEQRAIAHILGTLDDKIELNRRTNQTLVQIARALFTSWFVAFDPVRTKAEGRQPAGMDAATAARFPSVFGSSSIGSVPAGWEVRPIGDAVRVVGGSTPSTSRADYWDGEIAFCTPRDMAGLASPVLLNTARRVTESGLATISSGKLPIGTMLMSSRAPIGYLALAGIEVTVNQGMIAMICDSDLPNSYVLLWARQNMETIIGNANGTTFLEISKRNFRPIPVLVPPKPVLDNFQLIVSPIYDCIQANERESGTLATVRDSLLPRLLSGELRVPEAERLLAQEPA